MTEYREHEFASIFPMMTEKDLMALAEDIKENGQRAPITLLDGLILDGRNRYKACEIAGTKPRFRDYSDASDPLAFVISANVHRRQMTTSQRALVAAKIATLRQGGDRKGNGKDTGKTTALAAKELDVGKRTVETARQVLRDASSEDVKAIEDGKKTVGEVAKKAKAEIEKPKPEKPKEYLDKIGYPIPSDVVADWQRAESFNETLKNLHKVKLNIEKAIQGSDVIFREVTNTTTANLKNALGDLQRVIPHVVCPTCNGHGRKKCTTCRQRGFISKFGYEHWIPKEARELRERSLKKKK
jgi:ParB-like chromosome segregation protein Spo0J